MSRDLVGCTSTLVHPSKLLHTYSSNRVALLASVRVSVSIVHPLMPLYSHAVLYPTALALSVPRMRTFSMSSLNAMLMLLLVYACLTRCGRLLSMMKMLVGRCLAPCLVFALLLATSLMCLASTAVPSSVHQLTSSLPSMRFVPSECHASTSLVRVVSRCNACSFHAFG